MFKLPKFEVGVFPVLVVIAMFALGLTTFVIMMIREYIEGRI